MQVGFYIYVGNETFTRTSITINMHEIFFLFRDRKNYLLCLTCFIIKIETFSEYMRCF